jgi:hypothetical protein
MRCIALGVLAVLCAMSVAAAGVAVSSQYDGSTYANGSAQEFVFYLSGDARVTNTTLVVTHTYPNGSGVDVVFVRVLDPYATVPVVVSRTLSGVGNHTLAYRAVTREVGADEFFEDVVQGIIAVRVVEHGSVVVDFNSSTNLTNGTTNLTNGTTNLTNGTTNITNGTTNSTNSTNSTVLTHYAVEFTSWPVQSRMYIDGVMVGVTPVVVNVTAGRRDIRGVAITGSYFDWRQTVDVWGNQTFRIELDEAIARSTSSGGGGGGGVSLRSQNATNASAGASVAIVEREETLNDPDVVPTVGVAVQDVGGQTNIAQGVVLGGGQNMMATTIDDRSVRSASSRDGQALAVAMLAFGAIASLLLGTAVYMYYSRGMSR